MYAAAAAKAATLKCEEFLTLFELPFSIESAVCPVSKCSVGVLMVNMWQSFLLVTVYLCVNK